MIEVNSIIKTFDKKVVVNDLSFTINKGEIFGILGPNGAGKTTTFRMLTTLLKPDSGVIKINGKEITRNSNDIKEIIGMVSQHFSIQSEMTVWEIMELHGMLHYMDKKKRHEKINELLDFADLTNDKNKLAKQLSGGMKRKLMIIRAIMHDPEILFLDEPTVGLDPISRRSIWNLMEKLRKKGMAIVLTTHYIEEAEKLCDNIILINKGEKFLEGKPSELIEEVGNYTVEYFDGVDTKYYFFNSHEEAVDFTSKIEDTVTIRHSNLEDIFIKYTNKKVGV